MANIHVLNGSGASYRVVFHIPVPAGNNAVGVPWSSAVKNSKCCGTGATVLPDGDGTAGTISAAEKTDITNGVVVEEAGTLDTERYKNMSGAQRLAELDAMYAATVTSVQARLQAHLNFFGFTRG